MSAYSQLFISPSWR